MLIATDWPVREEGGAEITEWIDDWEDDKEEDEFMARLKQELQ